MELDLDLEQAVASLPSCTRCRRRRIKCDNCLPTCRNCLQADKECQFRDHVVGEDIPRQYLLSLIQHLQALNPSVSVGREPDAQDPRIDVHEDPHSQHSRPKPKPFDIFAASPQTGCLNDTVVSYYGPSSAYAYFAANTPGVATPEMPEQPANEPYRRLLHTIAADSRRDSKGAEARLPTATLTKALVVHYHRSVEPFLPILGEEWFAHINSLALDETSSLSFDDGSVLPALLHLVMAISLQLMSGYEASLGTMASTHFFSITEATVQRTLRHPNLQTFQLFALICVYVMLDREVGDVWSALHHAMSLYGTLDLDSDSGEDQRAMMVRRTLFILEVYENHLHLCS
ncbi:hypothetical protein A1O3_07034 [Capronia epimyces CBS 606.96]|uniref:Zn(2)-C6 fungal-type domain-containing protein n=1 Tax=Capronia epimyces CBS 606.96 TaxID=1182542 RepID=W9XTS9_9EURO|nr:uncharacterized protein A1O3_07034 [Capronia epimyces CBS 606.96]EXJ80750.1 hypothetical protein A1O3_07034 [Capronia epimyces CBS 606.96]